MAGHGARPEFTWCAARVPENGCLVSQLFLRTERLVTSWVGYSRHCLKVLRFWRQQATPISVLTYARVR